MRHFFVVIVVCGVFLLRCVQPVDSEKKPPAIFLTGKVLDKDGKPVANALARLVGKGLEDVTDLNGVYTIIDSTVSRSPSVQRAGAGRDSVAILRDGQVITMLEVVDWIDTLPDIFIVQRDIYGTFTKSPSSVGSITATIAGGGIPSSNPKKADLWYNAANNSYSGFVYFVYSTAVQKYSVRVDVYNTDTVFTGRSLTIEFPSTAGNINIPAFDPCNAAPVAGAGKDTTVSIGDTVNLRGAASDTFGGVISRYEWSIGGKPFATVSSADTAIVVPGMAADAYPCILRVTDDDGNTESDTVNVTIVPDPPAVSAAGDTTVSLLDTIRLRASGSDQYGKIVLWEWDIGATGSFAAASKNDTFAVSPKQPDTRFLCVARATDDDGQTATDTVRITVLADIPIANAGRDTMVFRGDTLRLKGSASQQFGTIVAWEWDIGAAGTFTSTPAGDTLIVAPRIPDSNYQCILRVTDDDGNRAADTVSIRVCGPGVKWVKLAPPFQWPIFPRLQVFNDKLILFDYQSPAQKTTVWSSGDGVSWTKLTDSAEFSPRQNFAAKSFANKIWVIGGTGDTTIWNSLDGKVWSKGQCCGFSPNSQFTFGECFLNRLWIIQSGTSTRHIFNSADGISWTPVEYSPGFSMDWLTSVLVFKDALWLLGPKGAIWKSADGKTYELKEAKLEDPVILRRHFGVVFNDQIVLMGGYYVFWSDNGETWSRSQYDGTPPNVDAHNSACAVFDGKIWIISKNGTWYSK